MRQVPLWTAWDAPVLVGLLALALAVARWGAAAGGEPRALRVTARGEARTLPLEPGVLTLEGDLGPTRVEVDAAGGVRFLESPCPQQLCRTLGRIHRAGEAVVCVPNRVLLELEGAPAGGLDAVTR